MLMHPSPSAETSRFLPNVRFCIPSSCLRESYRHWMPSARPAASPHMRRPAAPAKRTSQDHHRRKAKTHESPPRSEHTDQGIPRSLNSYSNQEKDHGGRENGDPHAMKGLPLPEFPPCTLRESIRIRSDHTVVDWYQRQ